MSRPSGSPREVVGTPPEALRMSNSPGCGRGEVPCQVVTVPRPQGMRDIVPGARKELWGEGSLQ